jgi:hypothetical protein
MNYRYKLLEKDYVLSQEEHDLVTESIKQRKPSVFLRNGTLMINMNFVAAISTTDDPTEVESQNARTVMKLPESTKSLKEDRKKGREFFRATHNEMYARMGWEHPDDCSCKKVPF